MDCNHLFIFTTEPDQVADELLSHGLIEGPNRVHPGQGTQNRKFYFDNFYFEILWVHNKDEICSERTSPAHLWERASFASSYFSQFGICLNNRETNDPLFENAYQYKPVYLPEGMSIEVLSNMEEPYLPWTFRWPTRSETVMSTPLLENQNRNTLTNITFDIEKAIVSPTYAHYFKENAIQFRVAQTNRVWLRFDNGKEAVSTHLKTVPLVLQF